VPQGLSFLPRRSQAAVAQGHAGDRALSRRGTSARLPGNSGGVLTSSPSSTVRASARSERTAVTLKLRAESLSLDIPVQLVRDGYEDYEYLEQLRRLGYGSEAQEIARSLFPAPYDTAKGDAQVQAVRTRLAQRLASILGGPTP